MPTRFLQSIAGCFRFKWSLIAIRIDIVRNVCISEVFCGRDCVAGTVTRLWARQTRCSVSIRKGSPPLAVCPDRLRLPLSLPFIPRTPKRFNPSCFPLKILCAFLLSPLRVLHTRLSQYERFGYSIDMWWSLNTWLREVQISTSIPLKVLIVLIYLIPLAACTLCGYEFRSGHVCWFRVSLISHFSGGLSMGWFSFLECPATYHSLRTVA